MASLNVNMPKDLRDFVNHRTSEGGFGTPTEYVRHLIRQDKEAQAERELERLVMEGIKSGRSRTDVRTFFARLHRRIDELANARV
jgi:antitoxin ParD1/3/4